MDARTLLADFEIRPATFHESLDILREKHLIGEFCKGKDKSLTALAGVIHRTKVSFHIARYGSYKLLFDFYERSQGVYDVHIACPKDSKIASRALALAVCAWTLKVGVPGAKGIITSCPEGKIANMIRKIGGTEVRKVGDTVYFMATAESFNLN